MKMKILLSKLLLMLCTFYMYAQGISYSDIVPVRNTPTESLNYNAHLWLENSAETEDITANIIEATHQLYSNDLAIHYDIKIEIAENEYTYNFYNFTHISKSGGLDQGLITEDELCFINPGKVLKVKFLHKTLCSKVKVDIDEHIRQRVKSLREMMRNEIKYAKWVYEDFPPSGIIYSEVIEIPNTTQDQLYSKSRVWFSKTYENVDRVIRKKDEKNGILIGESTFEYSPPKPIANDNFRGEIRYKIKLVISDGKLKYTISDFYHHAIYEYGLISPEGLCFNTKHLITAKRKDAICTDIKEKIDELTQTLISTLLETAQHASETKQSDQWMEADAKGGYLFTKVVQVDNLAKDELYEKSKDFLSKEYVNANRVLEIKDREAGELYAKVTMKFNHNLSNTNINFDLQLQVKDNQYKYSIHNFSQTSDKSLTTSRLGEIDTSYGFIYDNAERCFINKKLLMTKKQRQKTCAKLKDQIATEAQRLVNSMAETMR